MSLYTTLDIMWHAQSTIKTITIDEESGSTIVVYQSSDLKSPLTQQRKSIWVSIWPQFKTNRHGHMKKRSKYISVSATITNLLSAQNQHLNMLLETKKKKKKYYSSI